MVHGDAAGRYKLVINSNASATIRASHTGEAGAVGGIASTNCGERFPVEVQAQPRDRSMWDGLANGTWFSAFGSCAIVAAVHPKPGCWGQGVLLMALNKEKRPCCPWRRRVGAIITFDPRDSKRLVAYLRCRAEFL
jgi:hypothetical protein